MPHLMTILLMAIQAITPSEYAARRAQVARELGPNAMLVVFSAKPRIRDNDIGYPFRQDDWMLYLAGIPEPETTLVILPGEKEYGEIVFVPDSNPRQEMWTGHIPTHAEITAVSGISKVESANRFRQFLAAAFGGGNFDPVFYPRAMPAFYDAVRNGRAEMWIVLGRGEEQSSAFVEDLRKEHPDIRFRDAAPLLTGMREVKSSAEAALVQNAIDISLAGQKAGMLRSKTAANERDVQAAIERTFLDLGACCLAYPSIVASGKNATTLHYESDDAPVDRKGLMLVDAAAEVQDYDADITRTWPVSGKFSADQRAIYDAVYAVQEATIAAIHPGGLWVDVDRKTVDAMSAQLQRLGLISKNDPKQVRMYLPYLVGHHIGLAVHDVWDRGRPLEPNMILTVEPGIYVRRDDVMKNPTYLALSRDEQASIAKALDRYDGIGVRIEDEVIVTAAGARLMSGALPRSAGDIERFMSSK